MSTTGKSIVYVWDADYPWDVRTEKVTLALARAGHTVNIVARNKAWRQATESLPEGTVHRMPPWTPLGQSLDGLLSFPAFFSPRWINIIEKTCRDARADLIIVRDLPLCPTAIRVGGRLGIPVMLDMAENYPAMMRALWETGRHQPLDYVVRNPAMTQWLERRCVHRVDHIMVVVEESADRVAALGVARDRITIVSNTPPLARLDTATHVAHPDHSGIDVVYMGNLEVVRGLLESVDAIAHLKASGRRVRLRVIGRGRDEALIRQRCASHGLGPSDVEFLGYIASHEEALRVVAESDVGLMPHRKNDSWDTTIPNKLFDYMAAGIPVVSSDAAPCARILRETGAGCVFPSGDFLGIAAAIVEASAPGLGTRLGAAGRQAVRARYNWEYDTAVLLEAVSGTQKSGDGAKGTP
jgi:glycosyltransferase involved in cell wall biosynthesis